MSNLHPIMQDALRPFAPEDRRTGSDRRMAAVAEKPPTGDGTIVLDTVIQHICNMANNRQIPYTALTPLREDLLARAEMGLKKYGTKLRVNNGRKAAVDLYQEVMDGIMYAMQARMEGDNKIGRHLEALVYIGAQIASELNVR